MEPYYGILAGIIYGVIDTALMIPIKFDSKDEKKIAMIGAFASRFSIGFLIFNTSLPWSAWLNGLLIALIISLPSAIITKSYAPILGTAVIGGLILGYIAG